MRKLYGAVILATVAGLSGSAYAQNGVVSIMSPVDGAVYPTNAVSAIFSVKCSAGPHKVEWRFTGAEAPGSVTFYDGANVAFVFRLKPGKHGFKVAPADKCAEAKIVEFKVQ